MIDTASMSIVLSCPSFTLVLNARVPVADVIGKVTVTGTQEVFHTVVLKTVVPPYVTINGLATVAAPVPQRYE